MKKERLFLITKLQPLQNTKMLRKVHYMKLQEHQDDYRALRKVAQISHWSSNTHQAFHLKFWSSNSLLLFTLFCDISFASKLTPEWVLPSNYPKE